MTLEDKVEEALCPAKHYAPVTSISTSFTAAATFIQRAYYAECGARVGYPHVRGIFEFDCLPCLRALEALTGHEARVRGIAPNNIRQATERLRGSQV